MSTTFGKRGMRVFAVAALAAVGAAPSVLADIVGDGLTVIAMDESSGAWSSATFQVAQGADGNWRWASNETHVFFGGPDGNGGTQNLGCINPPVDGNATTTSIEYIADPIVNLNFSVAAGNSTTTFMIGSALLTFPTINSASGRASAAFTVTDLLGDGATLTGLTGLTNNSGYTSAVNGVAGPVMVGARFTDLLSVPILAAPLNSATDSEQSPGAGYTPIAGSVSSISSWIKFSLTANDLASGTTFFEVVPEPASLVLLALGGLLIRRR